MGTDTTSGDARSKGASSKRSTKRGAKTVTPSGASARGSSDSTDPPVCGPSWLDELDLERELSQIDWELEHNSW